ncbi:MAG: hypothetical protein E7331_04880 [Clostridiales bacterium]|nr:hypothetical protein [Clostridiales bacterium]
MMKSHFTGVVSCLGAVIGAGFVSGREVISFFSKYGHHSWWLIFLSGITMMLLCDILMRNGNCIKSVCTLSEKRLMGNAAQFVLLMVLFTLCGSMASAAGHMVQLIVPVRHAYWIGLPGSLCIAWLIAKGSPKPFSVISTALMALFLGMTFLALHQSRGEETVLIPSPSSFALMKAAVYAVGYGAMNVAVSISVMCQSGCGRSRTSDRRAACFGLCMCALLFISNALYLQHPQKMNDAFPIIGFFALFGKRGYIACVVLLYVAILTTLSALVSTLRSSLEARGLSPVPTALATLGLSTAVSLIGFAGIVNHLYAPGGLVCLVMVFLPMIKQNKKAY